MRQIEATPVVIVNKCTGPFVTVSNTDLCMLRSDVLLSWNLATGQTLVDDIREIRIPVFTLCVQSVQHICDAVLYTECHFMRSCLKQDRMHTMNNPCTTVAYVGTQRQYSATHLTLPRVNDSAVLWYIMVQSVSQED